jgi:hypothetical protein
LWGPWLSQHLCVHHNVIDTYGHKCTFASC